MLPDAGFSASFSDSFDHPEQLLLAIEQGELLARLIVAVDPDALDLRALNRMATTGEVLTRSELLQNHKLFINAAAALGVAVPQLLPEQLLRAREHEQIVFEQVWQLQKLQLLSSVSVAAHPELLNLACEGEQSVQSLLDGY